MAKITRRDFIQKSATAAAAGCAVPFASNNKLSFNQDDAGKSKIKKYKPFGKTGLNVSDISAGYQQAGPDVIDYIFKQGVNYIDTAYSYPGHEEMLGKVLPKWRDKVFVSSKWNPELVTATVTKEELLKALDVTLDRLKTTYIDCMMIHAIGLEELGDITRIQNPAIYEAYDEAKKLGKIRFSGASSCAPKMKEEFEWGIENDRFDVILCGANFLTRGLEPILKKARAKGVATIAMKTMTMFKSDLNIPSLRDESTSSRQAVIKYILSSNLFDTMIALMRTYDQVNEYLSVSGFEKLGEEETAYLDFLSKEMGHLYCRPGCDSCFGKCPNDVQIANILRYKMYFENYGREKHAMEKYKAIQTANNAAACTSCNAPCEDSCEFGLKVKDRLTEAHSQLTLT